MKNQKVSFARSFIMTALTLGVVGCGAKVAGTYMFNQTGTSINSACSTITLNLTSNSNQVSANGSNGACTETLTGYDNGNGTITVQSLTMTVVNSGTTTYNNTYSNQSCVYTGTLNVSGNQVSGSLTSTSSGTSGTTYNNSYSYCGTVQIQGTKSN